MTAGPNPRITKLMQPTTTRPATLADLIPGRIVYKGKGSTEWVVVSAPDPQGAPHDIECAGLAKATSKSKRAGNAAYHYTELRVAV